MAFCQQIELLSNITQKYKLICMWSLKTYTQPVATFNPSCSNKNFTHRLNKKLVNKDFSRTKKHSLLRTVQLMVKKKKIFLDKNNFIKMIQ